MNKNIISIDFEKNILTKEDFLREISEFMYDEKKIINKNNFFKNLIYREKISITAIGNNIAIPHCEYSSEKEEFYILICKLKNNINWSQSNEIIPVNIVILFAHSENNKCKEDYIKMAKICRKLANEEICMKINMSKNSKVIAEIINNIIED